MAALGPISIQPAEMVKLVAVIYVAAYLTKKEDRITLFRGGFLPALIVVGLLSGLVLLEPDLGTVVVIGLVTVGLFFLAGRASRICWAGIFAAIAGRAGAGPWLELSTSTAYDVSCPMEGCVGCRVSNHAIVPGLRQRGPVWSGIGRGQTKAVFSSGGAY